MSLSVHFCPPLSSSVEPPVAAPAVSVAPPAATTVSVEPPAAATTVSVVPAAAATTASVAPPAAATTVSPATTFVKLRQRERQGVAKGRSVKDTKMS